MDSSSGGSVFGRWLLRPGVTYIGLVALVVVGSYTLLGLGEGGQLSEVAPAVIDFLLRFGPVSLAVLLVLFLPAMVASVELVHRRGTTRLARSLICAAAWGGWLLVLALDGAALSHLFLWVDHVVAMVLVVAGVGAVYGILGFSNSTARAGWGLVTLSILSVALIIFGSIWMAGRWGGLA